MIAETEKMANLSTKRPYITGEPEGVAASIEQEKPGMPPFISVVVPVYNEEKHLGETLRQIALQDYPPDRYEVLIIDGMSSDSTLHVIGINCSLFQNCRVLKNPERLSSLARNIGFREARGEYIIIIDGHVYIENRGLFRDMVEIFEDTGLDVLSRPQPLTPPGNTYFQNAVAYARESFIGHGANSSIYNLYYSGPVDPASSGAMYRRSVIQEIGPFDESFDAAEDYEFNYRLGLNNKHSYISPKLTVYYYPRNSFRGLFRQMQRYGLGRNKMLRKHGEGFRSGAVAPPLFFMTLIILVALSFFIRPLWILPLMMAGIYVLALLAASFKVSSTRGYKYLPLLPFIYLTIHSGMAFGMVRGFFAGRKNGKNS